MIFSTTMFATQFENPRGETFHQGPSWRDQSIVIRPCQSFRQQSIVVDARFGLDKTPFKKKLYPSAGEHEIRIVKNMLLRPMFLQISSTIQIYCNLLVSLGGFDEPFLWTDGHGVDPPPHSTIRHTAGLLQDPPCTADPATSIEFPRRARSSEFCPPKRQPESGVDQ